MWLQVLLCFLVGFACASHYPAWQENTEYVYQVRGRTLTSLNQISNDYSGISLKGQMKIRPRSDGNLDAQILELQYAQIHAELEDWQLDIPDSELSYIKWPFPSEPFQIKIKNGALTDLVVSKSMSNWEANVIKSMVSQFQLDTRAQNLIPSHINVLAQEANNAVFKAMEETVTGESETLYEIHPLPEYVLQTTPWLVPLRHLKKDGKVIEVVKRKNFTHSYEQPSYHFGFHGIEDYDLDNKIGEFFTRTSVSRAVITGSLQGFTIQSTSTVDQIIMNPNLADNQRGSVNTVVNVTLLSVHENSQRDEEVSDPVNVGLVYVYNRPYSSSNEPQPHQYQNEDQFDQESAEADSMEQSERTNRRKLEILLSQRIDSSDSSGSSEFVEDLCKERPELCDAPESPLLPFTVGYDGQTIKKKKNIVEIARKLTQKIAYEYQHPQDIPKQNTVGKFVILTSLLRVMNLKEMQELVEQLYRKRHEDNFQPAVWGVCQDAVAQTGTGPALLIIKHWIESDKVKGEVAAEIVSTAADAARQPTEQYMQTFYELVQSKQVTSQTPLNETALFSYTKLVHEVYVNQAHSHNKYPVHSFKPFNTQKGRAFVRETLIPDLNQKLQDAIAEANTQHIHVYIRALGNVGHQRILEAFKPYLEGQKKASHFQRFLMVAAMDKLARSNPRVARTVFYKIYQNSNEDEQVRVAAVYRLFYSNPSPSMLQRIASYTNDDPNHYVNAAVKSAIESASKRQEPEYAKLRAAARSAKPLLTSREYGAQYPQKKLRSFVAKELQESYKQSVQIFNGEDFVWPKGIIYYLRGRFGGVAQEIVNMQAMVSSLDDFVNLFHQKTKKYQDDQKIKQSYNAISHEFSSDYVAKLLNMQNEQREQLEGNLYFDISALQRMWSFDNHTVENITEVVRELEEELKKGKSLNYYRMSVQYETAVSFPTALGLPFIYTYDRPTFVKFEGNVKGRTNPPISSENVIVKPETLNLQFEIQALVSARTQSQYGFFFPLDDRRYSAGYDKNFQVVIPLSGNINGDIEKNQLQVELQIPEDPKDVNLLHFSSIPYTAQSEIYDPKPQKKIISKKHPIRVNKIIGQKSTGIAFKLQMTSEQPIDCAFYYDKLRQHDWISAMLSPWLDENIQHTEINVGINSAKTNVDRITIQGGWKYNSRESGEGSSAPDISQWDDIPNDPLSRQDEFVKMAGGGIKQPTVHMVDLCVGFSGRNQINHTVTVSGSRSNIDPKGRLLLQYKNYYKQEKPLNFYLLVNTLFPNIDSLNLNNAMEMDPTSTINVKASLGEKYSASAKIDASLKLSKSEQRKQYLMELLEYEECQRQMQEGNYQLPACAKMTAKANFLDQFKANLNYEFDDRLVNHTYKLYSVLRQYLYPYIEENIVPESSRPWYNKLDIEGHFHPDLKAVNFSIMSQYGKVQARNVEVSDWVRNVMVPHPIFHVTSRAKGHFFNYDTYTPICVADQNAANTFDNRTYPLNLGNDWTVLLQYVPRRPSPGRKQPEMSVPKQLDQHIEAYIVHVRASSEERSQKEVKMLIQTPETNGAVVEITLKPAGSSKHPKLFIGKEEIPYGQDGFSKYDGYLQVYPLPKGEVRVEISGAFHATYDGKRVKLAAVNCKFRDASRGLCGTFNGAPETDFVSPADCIVKNPEDFVNSYVVSKRQSQKLREDKCYRKEVKYVQVISPEDVGRYESSERRRPSMSCTKHQTRYMIQNDEVCFTVRPLPVCKAGCRQKMSVSRNISVHCVASSRSTDMWMRQIDNGESPNFSTKPQTRKIRMEIPTRCSP